jgi:hypothetical protein
MSAIHVGPGVAQFVTLPRKAALALAAAIRSQRSGNFTIHLRFGEVMGTTFEVKESYTDLDRRDEVSVG